MFCLQCGIELPDTAQFCYSCGAKTATSEQEISQHEPQHKSQDDLLPLRSVIGYIRPRGIPGQYKVAIIFELASGEHATVFADKYLVRHEVFHLNNLLFDTKLDDNFNVVGTRTCYLFSHLLPGQSFSISLSDKDIPYHQNTSYFATSTGIEEIAEESVVNGVGKIVSFHEIPLVDVDNLPPAEEQKPEIQELRKLLQTPATAWYNQPYISKYKV